MSFTSRFRCSIKCSIQYMENREFDDPWLSNLMRGKPLNRENNFSMAKIILISFPENSFSGLFFAIFVEEDQYDTLSFRVRYSLWI